MHTVIYLYAYILQDKWGGGEGLQEFSSAASHFMTPEVMTLGESMQEPVIDCETFCIS